MFTTILFDLDGTLVDPLDGISLSIHYALERMGRPCPAREELGWCIGPSLRASFPILLGTDDPGVVEEAVVHYRERYFAEGKFGNEVYPGVVDTLAALRQRGAKLILATNKSEAVARQIIEHHGLARFFADARGVAPASAPTPDKAGMIAAILADHGLDPSRTLMVGDRKFDALGARANAVACAGALYGYGGEEELREAGATWLIDAPAGVLTLMLDE